MPRPGIRNQRPGHPHFKLNVTWVKLENMKQLRIPGILTILAFALVGCGDTQTESDEPQNAEEAQTAEQEPEPMSQDPTADIEYTLDQEYFFYGKSPDVIGKFNFPSEPLPEAEELREYAGADEVTYVTITIDNRQGTESQGIQGIDAFDEAGQKYEFIPVSDMSEQWENLLPTDEDGMNSVEDTNRFIDFYNAHLHGADAGEMTEFTVAYDGTDLPEDLTRIAVYTMGTASEPVAALPTDHPEAQHVDLDFEAPTQD